MTQQQFLGAPVEIIVYDGTLELAELQAFSRDYSVRFGNEVRVISRWGGPAAGPPEWAGPEVAVIVVIAYDLLKHFTSDAYQLVKKCMLDAYRKVRTRTGARWYVNGALAIAAENEKRTLRVLFCLPEGLGRDELTQRIELVEHHANQILKEWEGVADTRRSTGAPFEAKVTWDENEGRWRPSPAELEKMWRQQGVW